MTTPLTNFKDYNVLIQATPPSSLTGSRTFKWALLHRTHVVRSTTDSVLNGIWHGVASVSSFSQSLGSLSSGNMVLPTVTVELSRTEGGPGLSDDDLDAIRSLDYLLGARIDFYLVKEGDEFPSEENRFHVAVIERGDVEIGRLSVRLTCRDRRESEDITIPRALFPYDGPVEEKALGQRIPILIGEWGRENSDYWIPATCVDTALVSTTTPIRAQLCRPGENGIGSFGSTVRWLDSDGRYKRDETGFRELPIVVVDASEGLFELGGTDFETFGVRWEEGDRIEVCRPRGETDDQGQVITSPSEVIRHLLTDHRVGMGLDDDDIDDDAFRVVSEVMEYYGYKCRSYIDRETTVLTAVSQICYEFGLKLMVRNGRYALVYLGWNDAFNEPSRRIVPGQITDWKEWNDRRRSGAYGLQIAYRYRPQEGTYTRNRYFTSDFETTAGWQKVESSWIYDDYTAEQRGSNWMLMFEGMIRSLVLNLDFEGLGLALGDYVFVTYPEGEGIFQVTEVNFSFDPPLHLEIELQSTNRPPASGVWSAEEDEEVPEAFGGGLMPAGWSDALQSQREGLSFWVGDDDLNPDGTAAKIWAR